MDALDVSRWQFGITTVYHFIFVPLTIGLAPLIAVMQTVWHVTGNAAWYRLTRFFGKLFLINFAIGVATGIVQEFQFGMNWSEYSKFVGDIFGAPLAFEGLIAFFFESTFIGLWIFGWTRLPKGIHYATFGSGSGPHLAGALLEQAAGIQLQDVPYRGSSQSLIALMGGEIQLGIDTVAAAAPQVKARKLRALAIAGKSRSSMLPGVPTVEELKLPDAVFDAWYAIAAPAKTSPSVIRKLVAEVEAVTRDSGLQEQMRTQGLEPVHLGPVGTRATIDDEIGRYRALAHRAKIVVD